MTLEIEIAPDRAVPLLIAGSRFRVETRFAITATAEPGLPYDVVLRFELRDRRLRVAASDLWAAVSPEPVTAEGLRFECSALEVHSDIHGAGGPPITLAGMRSIPVETLLRRAVQRYVGQLFADMDANRQVPGRPKVPPVPARRGGPLGLPLPPPRKAKRRGPDDDLDLAALVYDVSQMCGLAPTKAVADHFRIPLGTARDLVRRARGRALP